MVHGIEDGILIADEREMIVARQFEKLRAGNLRGEIPPFFDPQAVIARAMNHEGRDAD